MSSEKKVVIVGAGLGGLAAGIALRRKLGLTDFKIYEKGWDVGGTWRENSYPGCACDVPSHWYSLSTDPNPNWSHEFSSQPEILAYLRDTAERNKLLKENIEFGTKLVSGAWDDSKKQYDLTIARLDKQGNVIKEETVVAHVLVSAIGALSIPQFPNIKGIETFKGDIWHAAQWRWDIPLTGKRVGIIGNGCSACQIVPVISEDPSVEVVNFCRTPSWFAPRPQVKFWALTRWIFKYVPFVHAFYRFWIFAKSDLQYLVWKKENKTLRKIATWLHRRYIMSQAPAHLHDKLIPKYEFGCKRIIRDPGYLASLHRKNVTSEWTGIQEIVEDGIILKDGTKQPLDILVPCTGFQAASMIPPLKGLKGTAEAQFDAIGGPEAYRGTTVPNFPNMFMILGPNVASGHASAIFAEEVQVNYAVQLIKPIVQGKIDSFVVKDDASEKFNAELQHRIKNTVWDSCLSYYNQQGGKNIAMYPGTVVKFWRSMSSVIWKDYDVSPAKSANGHANGNGKLKAE